MWSAEDISWLVRTGINGSGLSKFYDHIYYGCSLSNKLCMPVFQDGSPTFAEGCIIEVMDNGDYFALSELSFTKIFFVIISYSFL